MVYLLAAVAGVVGAVVGYVVTGVVAVVLAGWYGMSDFEGARGMFAFLGVAPLGGLVGMVGSAWLVLRLGKGAAPLGPTVVRVGGVLAGIAAAAVAAVIFVRLQTLDTYTNTAPPTLEFEVRLPAGIALANRDGVQIELHTDRNVGESYFAEPWVRTEGDRQIIAGGVPLMVKTSSRPLVVSLPGESTRLFRLPLSKDPASSGALGDWRRADHVDAPGADGPVAARADDPVELRYRVTRPGED